MLMYFVPQLDHATHQTLRQRGIEVAGQGPLQQIAVKGGPQDVGNGILVCFDSKPGRPLRYEPNAQTWKPIKGEDDIAYWIGWYTDAKPGPMQLARQHGLGGRSVRLADGQEWIVPVVYLVNCECQLPRRYGIGDGGQTEALVAQEYRGLLEKADQIMDAISQWRDSNKTDLVVDVAMLADALICGLGFNYRLGRAEVLALELLDDKAIARGAFAMVEFDKAFEAVQKKTLDMAARFTSDLPPVTAPPPDNLPAMATT